MLCDFCHSTMPNVINIHMVPHSHDDVGWKETVDEYYSQGRIQIKKIYDSVIRALVRKENRRFVCFKVKNPLFFFFSLSHFFSDLMVNIKVALLVYRASK